MGFRCGLHLSTTTYRGSIRAKSYAQPRGDDIRHLSGCTLLETAGSRSMNRPPVVFREPILAPVVAPTIAECYLRCI